MGLLDFAANLGKKLFGKEAEAAENIQTHIEADNPGVQGLNVSYDGGTVKLEGEAASAEAMEKAVLMAGNVQGVEQVDVSALSAPEQTARVEFYTIESGDTLWAIAERFLGKGSLYPRIFEANREVIKDADLIYPGQKIRIPLD